MEIRYKGNRSMIIHLEEFFPTSHTRIRKLMKIVQMDYEHCDALKDEIIIFLNNHAEEDASTARVQFKAYVDTTDRVKELKSESDKLNKLVERNKELAKVKTAKANYKILKEKARDAKRLYIAARNMNTAYKRTSEKYALRYKKLLDNMNFLDKEGSN